MSAHEELDPMSGLAARALAAERDHLPRDAARAERLFSRVVVTVGAVAVATGSAAAAGSAAAGSAAAGSSAGAPLASGAAKVAGATMTAKAAVGLAALAFALGTGAGVALERTRSPEHAAPRSEPSSSASSSAAPVPEVPASVLSAATPPSASVATSRPSSSPVPVPPEATATTQDQKDAELAAERALVDRARSALGRGDTAASLEAVAAHETRFPRGRLTEERELVAIQTLVRRGDGAAAKARADRFRKTHPKSVFLPAIDRLVPP